MNSEKLGQYFAILVAIIMIFSIIAIAFLYNSNERNNSAPQTENISTKLTEFTYTTTFDSTVIREAGVISFAAVTKSIDKMIIDQRIERIPGVRSTNSKLEVLQDKRIAYFAEISLRKDANQEAILKELVSLNELFYLEQNDFEIKKYVMISVPEEQIILYNKDLNIERKYSFDKNTFTTLTALASIETIPRDEIIVSGTIKLMGNQITSINLEEKINKTNSPQEYTLIEKHKIIKLEEIITFEGSVDANSQIDENTLKSELTKAGIDANVSFIAFGNKKYFFGETKNISKIQQLQQIIESQGVEKENLEITQPAYFKIEKIYLPKLQKEFEITDSNVSARITPKYKAGDEVELKIIATITRGNLIGIRVSENQEKSK